MPKPAPADLFSAASPKPTASRGLTISSLSDAALSPEQRKYNQLVAKVEKARAELHSWDTAGSTFANEHTRLMRPLMADLAAQRRQLALKLADLLAHGGHAKKERRTLARSLCEEAATLVQSEFIDEAAAAELEALHDQHADIRLADERREALDNVKGMIEAMSGVDLGDVQFESEEDLLRHAHERVQAAAAAGHELPPSPFGPQARPGPAQRQTAAQRKRQQQQAQKQADEAAQASQSVREIFRRLASALHPDRAEDDADRARRTALMQRVNQAYEAQDLLALFSLQLEIEQIDAEHLARAGAERVRHYNRVLATQLAELQAEVAQREMAFTLQYGIDVERKLSPHKLGRVLEEALRDIRFALNQVTQDLKLLDHPAGVKRFVQREREQHQFDDEGPFGFSF